MKKANDETIVQQRAWELFQKLGLPLAGFLLTGVSTYYVARAGLKDEIDANSKAIAVMRELRRSSVEPDIALGRTQDIRLAELRSSINSLKEIQEISEATYVLLEKEIEQIRGETVASLRLLLSEAESAWERGLRERKKE